MDEPRKPGRPATGRTRRHEIHSYLNGDEFRRAKHVADATDLGMARLIRAALEFYIARVYPGADAASAHAAPTNSSPMGTQPEQNASGDGAD